MRHSLSPPTPHALHRLQICRVCHFLLATCHTANSAVRHRGQTSVRQHLSPFYSFGCIIRGLSSVDDDVITRGGQGSEEYRSCSSKKHQRQQQWHEEQTSSAG